MEIQNKKKAFLVILIVAVAIFLVGYFFAPRENIQESQIDEDYTGRIIGKGVFDLERRVGSGGNYEGVLSGNFNGTIFRLGKPFTVLSIINGTFNGKITGDCLNDDCTVISAHQKNQQIDGSANVRIKGKLIEVEKIGMEFSWEIKLIAGLVIVLFLLRHFGLLGSFINWFRYSEILGGKNVIRKSYRELREELEEWLREELDIVGRFKILEKAKDSSTQATIMYILVQLSPDNGSRWIIVSYCLGNFDLEVNDAEQSDWDNIKEEIKKSRLKKEEIEKEVKSQLAEWQKRRLEELERKY